MSKVRDKINSSPVISVVTPYRSVEATYSIRLEKNRGTKVCVFLMKFVVRKIILI